MQVQRTQQEPPPHVAIVATTGMGHLIPLVELAKRLVVHHNFLVTFLIPTDGSPIKPQQAVLQDLTNAISSIFLPPVSIEDLPEDVKVLTRIELTLTRSLPALRDSFKVLAESSRLVALVVDLFGSSAFDVAKEFGVPSYVFFTSTAMLLSLMFYLPELDGTYSCEYGDLPEPVKLPGCVPIHGSDLSEAFQDRKNEAYKGILHIAKRFPLAVGIMVNSFLDLEPGSFKAMMEGKEGRPPLYPIGPLVQSGPDHGVDDSECLRWLDKQPHSSVLFVSFGSGGTLSHEQLHELALGLEKSGQRFLWVVRSPHEKAANAAYFSEQSIKDPFPFLPEGFLERTKGVGLVVPSWAPQVQILKHASTGGFLSHCGWNSTLESIVHGVPLIAWPLYAEQRMNSVLLADDLKVALRVKVNDKGLVGHKDIANYARGVIKGEEGKLLKSKMKEVKNAAERALSQEGLSTKSLAEVAQIWKSSKEK
ncbi:hydroquinone glucosyltransferase-like [Corylus avellana]|uniref:hydroquinone glucosyltransferase-like n=1 Tax=Corylus avellana TaxID=13451 RepID=UPI00286A6246|nr:hydroquinone glucosyltransferase-like [Corylus avellana]